MQSAGRSLRHVSHITSSLRTSQIATCSRGQWHTRGYAWGDWTSKIKDTINKRTNSLQNFGETLSPKTREQDTTEEIEAARKQQQAEGSASFFDTPLSKEEPEPEEKSEVISKTRKKKFTEHKYSTANFKISHRKLNMLGRQISGKPIDYAILQMQFSEKRASKRIKSMLALAKQHAIQYKKLDPSKLIVSESWVTKGPNSHKRLEPRGRGHRGIRVRPDSRMTVVLREGKTFVEKKNKEREKKLRAVRSAGLIREDVPLRNPAPMWGW